MTLSPEILAEGNNPHVVMVLFVKLEMETETFYLHTAVGEFSFDGQTWQGLGDFGTVSPIQEGSDMSAYSMTLYLSGLNEDGMMDEVLNQNYALRPVTLYIGMLDEDGVLVGDPEQKWLGTVSGADASLGEDNGIRLTCESEMAVLDQNNGSLYSDAHLQSEFPGDLLFEYAEQMDGLPVIWGGAPANLGTPTAPQFDVLGGNAMELYAKYG